MMTRIITLVALCSLLLVPLAQAREICVGPQEQERWVGGDFRDSNETDEAIKFYNAEMQKFGMRRLDATKEKVLVDTLKKVEAIRTKYPQSRHLVELSARVEFEAYENTGKKDYLTRSANNYLLAEDLGMKEPMGDAHYYDEVALTLSLLGDRGRLDSYFFRVFEKFPLNGDMRLQYANALARLGDNRAEEYYIKSIEISREGSLNERFAYAEFLLDKKDPQSDEKALEVLEKLPYTRLPKQYFFKGVALERLGRTKEAEAEYKKFMTSEFVGGKRKQPIKYKIPNSSLQSRYKIPFD
jgi:hypothetical protein